MEQFATDEQQEEAIKRFFKENGLPILAGAVIGISSLYGWRYYTDNQMASMEQASIAYQEASTAAFEAKTPEQLATFVNETQEAGYKSISAFVLAKQYVDQDNLSAAADVLENLLVAEKESPLGAIAALRLASVQMQQEQFEAVITTLEYVTQTAFTAQKMTLKGDALVALTRIEEAKTAYLAALEQAPNANEIQMKLDNLALSSGA